MNSSLRMLIGLAALSVASGCGGGGSDDSGDSLGETASSSSSNGTGDETSTGPDSETDTGPDSETDTGTDTGEPDRPTFYVSLSGDDQDPGTLEAPWRTLQHAADTIAPGELAVVLDGNYEDEYVIIDRSGEADARLSFEAETLHGARYRGITIRGDEIDIDGFEIEANLDTLTGVFVDGSSDVTVKNCFVHDCPRGGIDISGASIDDLADHVEVIGNHMHHNGQWGIHVVGSYVLVEGNEISDSVQHHPKGDEPGSSGHDADGMRIFGDHHTIASNYIHGVADPSDPEHNIDPHADCLQTWDRQDFGGRPIMTDSVFEGNHCVIQHPTGKGIIMEAMYDNPGHDITIRNNIFEFRDEGVDASGGSFANIFIYNNVFKAQLEDDSWGVAVYMNASMANYDVRNNIMVDCHNESRKILSNDGVVDYNLLWYSDGSAVPMMGNTPGPQAHELWDVNPMFVDYDGGVGGDFHLQPGSPAIDAGADLVEVSEDYDHVPRPQGLGRDIGAYESGDPDRKQADISGGSQ